MRFELHRSEADPSKWVLADFVKPPRSDDFRRSIGTQTNSLQRVSSPSFHSHLENPQLTPVSSPVSFPARPSFVSPEIVEDKIMNKKPPMKKISHIHVIEPSTSNPPVTNHSKDPSGYKLVLKWFTNINPDADTAAHPSVRLFKEKYQKSLTGMRQNERIKLASYFWKSLGKADKTAIKNMSHDIP